MNPDLSPIIRWLEESRDFGFLGPGDLGIHVEQGRAFAGLVAEAPAGPVADLGSGGGVPGLIIAALLADRAFLLVESSRRRSEFLRRAVESLAWDGRVTVLEDRAEDVGRSARRGCLAAVTARGFGPPATTAECIAALLLPGGRGVVSDPPELVAERWSGLVGSGLGLEPTSCRSGGFNFQILRPVAPCPDRFPRRVGVPAHRPLF